MRECFLNGKKLFLNRVLKKNLKTNIASQLDSANSKKTKKTKEVYSNTSKP